MKMWGLDRANEECAFILDAARHTRWADMQGRQAGKAAIFGAKQALTPKG